MTETDTNYHLLTMDLIKRSGMSVKKIAEVLSKSTSVIYDKKKNYKGNKFTESQYELISKHINNLKTEL